MTNPHSPKPAQANRNPWWAGVLVVGFVVFMIGRDGDGSFGDISAGGWVTFLLVFGVPAVLLWLIVRALWRVGKPVQEQVVFVAPQELPVVEQVAPTGPKAPPSGWYSSPDGDGEQWWDGFAWSEHRRRPN
ncbi:hypothetical protein ACFWU5_16115 [Nocardia sp. NPDC058640]|uniref:hypothetical protein n=1 Tax=Nocardia sp. NPDC058640 TaxID=3346571 RepID=UPI003658F8AC